MGLARCNGGWGVRGGLGVGGGCARGVGGCEGGQPWPLLPGKHVGMFWKEVPPEHNGTVIMIITVIIII